MRVSSIRRARWQRGRANSGAEGRWQLGFTGGEACWPAAQVGGELKAEQRNVHTLPGKPAGEVRESQRGGAQGTRAGRARTRARGGWGRRRAARARPAGRSERRGAQSWKCTASKGAPRLLSCHPRRCPELRRAPPRSASPASPSWSRGRGRIHSPRMSLADPGLPGGSASRGPRGRADCPGRPQSPVRRSSLRGPGAQLPGLPGRTGKEEAKKPGPDGAGAWDPLRGGRGQWTLALRSPQPLWAFGERDGNPLFWSFPGTS